jgi:hypothetical protein
VAGLFTNGLAAAKTFGVHIDTQAQQGQGNNNGEEFQSKFHFNSHLSICV